MGEYANYASYVSDESYIDSCSTINGVNVIWKSVQLLFDNDAYQDIWDKQTKRENSKRIISELDPYGEENWEN